MPGYGTPASGSDGVKTSEEIKAERHRAAARKYYNRKKIMCGTTV
jgi:hypothetical protein